MATETVTVLFTDLVGSTELLTLGGGSGRPTASGALRAAASRGDRRRGPGSEEPGDGLMVTFESVGAGLACAAAMQQAMAARRQLDRAALIRVGVGVGEAESEEGDYFGLPVVEAARLCARAEGGKILTTDMVRLLARSRGGFHLESLGELELEGLDDPVTAHRVHWEPLADRRQSGAPDRPRGRRPRSRSCHVGRDQ